LHNYLVTEILYKISQISGKMSETDNTYGDVPSLLSFRSRLKTDDGINDFTWLHFVSFCFTTNSVKCPCNDIHNSVTLTSALLIILNNNNNIRRRSCPRSRSDTDLRLLSLSTSRYLLLSSCRQQVFTASYSETSSFLQHATEVRSCQTIFNACFLQCF